MEAQIRVSFNRYFFFVICVAGGALLSSFLAEKMFFSKPCTLCKLQRIPFALLLVNALFGLSSSYKQSFLRVTQVCFALGLILAITHFLIQTGLVPDFCVSKKEVSSPEAFLLSLQSSSCASQTWAIFGVPISLLNVGIHALCWRFSQKAGYGGRVSWKKK